ncbi:branched-chain amino acid ABC transporter permease [Conexibacter stalactiti]|uniref:Branched-chain amino acid ABC transporter permease n=1 Tax=Conexibacter stalactiti TaxID=1940611 RepID=A0ABU4HZW4_9ACTN|nr:branched-chain amino acid ABC transporter permease [Conexibacter stalactiti]MDW5598755.1 branched-chain amino acid ABC transporter permease [Conexibacter stalactiti]MEC5039397.1 branched-chain amino acid ABC transporter permease [Conexibacter stalactiti]
MNEFFQQSVNALSLGSTYALLALGLAIVFSILGMINFAHSELLTLGGYALWGLTAAGVPFLFAALGAIVAAGLIAVLMERIAFRPFRGSGPVTLLITSFAVGFLIQSLLSLSASEEPAHAVAIPDWLSSTVNLFGLNVPALQLVTMAVTAACLAAVVLFLKRTLLGVAMRAAADDFDVVRLMGVRADRVVAAAFALSGALAGVAAVLAVAQAGSVDPTTGVSPTIKAFIAVVLGGLGSLGGAVAGGLLLGALEVLLQATLPDAWLPYRDALVLTLVVIVLLARPSGLLARRSTAEAAI